jgi:lysophospholipase L1-like esterase/pimeloyl-ACP methyl ester carboxylesterase
LVSTFPIRIQQMKNALSLLVLFLATTTVSPLIADRSQKQTQPRKQPSEQRIVFLGDSITQAGRYVEHIEAALAGANPDLKQTIISLGLGSETVSGLSEPGHAGGKFPRPDLHERLDRVLEKSNPDLVIACYGMNDGIYHPLDEQRMQAFQSGMKRLHDKVIAKGARIIHVTPPVFDSLPIKSKVLPAGLATYEKPYEGYDEVLEEYSNWLIEMRSKEGWEVIDLHGPMKNALNDQRKADASFTYSKDGIHPTPQGHQLIATTILNAWGLSLDQDGISEHPHGREILELVRKKQSILRPAWLSHVGHKRPGLAPGLPLDEANEKADDLDIQIRELVKQDANQPKPNALPNKTGQWNGYDKHELKIAGKLVTIIAPAQAAPGLPWAWHGEFFGHKPAPDIALLGHGFHIVYMKINDMLGSPPAVDLWNQCYAEMTSRYALNKKPALVGLSRGGLYCYNWAIANPDKVSCIYADAPVCDFKSWPGGKGKGKGDSKNWALVLKLWKFSDESSALASKANPIDNLSPLARHHVSLLHVFGDADDVVPWEENTGIVATKYKELGGDITLIRKSGVGHHPHGLEDSQPIVDFILKNVNQPLQ